MTATGPYVGTAQRAVDGRSVDGSCRETSSSPSGSAVSLALAVALAIGAVAPTAARAQGTDETPFTLTSAMSHSGGMLPLAQVNNDYGCKGGNSAPDLQWSAVPKGAKSLAITMFDSTARNGAGFWHWALFDVPADMRTLQLGQAPKGAKVGRNAFGVTGFGGACPPPGQMHQYHFTVWALPDEALPFDTGAPDEKIGSYLKAHAIGQADLMFMYQR